MTTERLRQDAITQLVAETACAQLGDPRRAERAAQMMARMAALPNESLPNVFVTEAELEAAYRFFSNDRVSFGDLLEPHAESAARRAAKAGVVLAVHDTTTAQFGHADAELVGYLPTGKPGFLLHLTLLVDTRDWRRPLGIVHAEPITRDKPPRKARRGKKRRRASGRETAQRKNKESDKWMRGVNCVEERLAGRASVIHVADRECDSYAFLSVMVETKQRFIIRANHDRIVNADGEQLHVREFVERAIPLLVREVPLSRRLSKSSPKADRTHPPREARSAKLKFASTTATLQQPRYGTKSASTSTIVNVVHVFEVDPPLGQQPVDWLLYTTEPIKTADQLATIVDYYRCRWLIEEFNKALKTGCAVQKRQLESYDAIMNMLAMSLPIAVELLALRSLARADPTRPATSLFSRGQLDALRHISHRPVPKKATVQDVLWAVAGLGGHIKNNGQPGWLVLHRGMEKFLTFAEGWCAAKGLDL
jgi:hypothetical protein